MENIPQRKKLSLVGMWLRKRRQANKEILSGICLYQIKYDTTEYTNYPTFDKK